MAKEETSLDKLDEVHGRCVELGRTVSKNLPE
jgi:hypothetical protein